MDGADEVADDDLPGMDEVVAAAQAADASSGGASSSVAAEPAPEPDAKRIPGKDNKAPPEDVTEASPHVEVRFVSELRSCRVPSTPILLPTRFTRAGLGEVVNQLLGNDPPRLYDFLLQGQLLSGPLGRALEQRELSTEAAVVLEVVTAELPPDAVPPLTSADAFAGEKPEYRRQSLCRGAFRFYHYSVDGFRDHGWGCGLRTTQLMLSWLSSSPPPPIPRMQAILQRANPAAFTGERGWIGVNDAVVLLDELHGAPVRVLSLRSGGELFDHLGEIADHFDAGGGPVMIGGSTDVYSKGCIGVRRPHAQFPDGSLPELLILDPHYSGPAARDGDVEELAMGKWAAWKKLGEVITAQSFYNIGLPTRPAERAEAGAPPQPAAAGMGDWREWKDSIEVVGSG